MPVGIETRERTTADLNVMLADMRAEAADEIKRIILDGSEKELSKLLGLFVDEAERRGMKVKPEVYQALEEVTQ